MSTAERAPRLSPDARRAKLLDAARTVIARDGLAQFSLNEVAEECGVAASLPRHYFGSRDGLLVAVARQIIEEVVAILGAPRGTATMTERLAAYVELIARTPWVHTVWLHASEYSSELDELVQGARRTLAELSFDVRSDDLPPSRQLALQGWVGYFEAVISGWIDQGAQDHAPVIDALADAARRLGMQGV